MDKNRKFMKANFTKEVKTGRDLGLEQPSLVKSIESELTIDLPKVNQDILKKDKLHDCIVDRKTRRLYSEDSLSLEELSYILWSSQGVKEIRKDNTATVRTVPSAAARHPYETYIIARNVEGLDKAIYMYLPLEHKLGLIEKVENLEEKLVEASGKQVFLAKGAVSLVWSCLPARGEWRFGEDAHKMMLIDVGHICQSVYLVGESLDLGVCAIGHYNQEKFDKLIGVDGINEYVVYLASIGNKK